MNKPIRIQRKRTKGYKLPENAVSVTRPGRWGNPFKFDMPAGYSLMRSEIATLVEQFRDYAEERMEQEPEWLVPLRGKDLACFCSLSNPCHADVLLELANQ